MTPVFTTKGSRQHRYYVTRLKPGEDRKIRLADPRGETWTGPSLGALPMHRQVAQATSREVRRAPTGSRYWKAVSPRQRRVFSMKEVRVQVAESELIVDIRALSKMCSSDARPILKERNECLRLVLAEDTAMRELGTMCCSGFLPMRSSRSRQLLTGRQRSARLQITAKRTPARLLKLSWLAPDIVAAISPKATAADLDWTGACCGPRMCRWTGKSQRRFLASD